MGIRTRSARGQVVDFELLSIKQQLMNLNIAIDVKERKDFIDHKDSGKSTSSFIEKNMLDETDLEAIPSDVISAIQDAVEQDLSDAGFLIDPTQPIDTKTKNKK